MSRTIKSFNNKIALLLILFSMGTISCEKWLDISPKDSITNNSLWASTGSADLFLNNIYAGLPGPFQTIDPEENFTDNAMNGVNGQISRILYAASVYTPSNAPSYWGQYDNIRKCNLFIKGIMDSKLQEKKKKKLRLAEARFLRAYYYQLLWTHYGGVPIITEPLTRNGDTAALYNPRNTYEETINFIT